MHHSHQRGRPLSVLWAEFRINTVPQEGSILNMYTCNPEENPESHTEGVSSLLTAFITISLLPVLHLTML